MKQFSAIDYLAIDIANHAGFDKKNFEDRIQWVRDNFNTLEAQEVPEPYLYKKAVMAFRRALKGLPIGHMVALDSVASGMQLMSVMTGCVNGCTITGLVDPDTRMDAYTEITKAMNALQPGLEPVSRSDIKNATMCGLYGSKAVPKRVFPEEKTLELFYKALDEQCGGALWLLHVLIQAWNKSSKHHSWTMPDGFEVYIPNMVSKTSRVNITELKYTMSVEYYENDAERYGVSLPANVIHSADSFVLRSLVRRCNYDRKKLLEAAEIIELELMERHVLYTEAKPETHPQVIKYSELWRKSQMVDLVFVNHINQETVSEVNSILLRKLNLLISEVLAYEPFEVVTVHDAFMCHPNHCNRMRYWYKEILAELAESHTLRFILSQLMDDPELVFEPTAPVSHLIRNSDYGIC